MVALTFDQTSGFTKIWDTPVIPLEISGVGKWAGIGIWGSQPSVDLRNLDTVFIATGNTYSVPKEFETCQDSANATSKACLPSGIWQESVIAFDANTGIPRWVHQLSPLDAWTVACRSGNNLAENCPQVPGPDADFGMAPSYIKSDFSYRNNTQDDVLIVGQKNGIIHSLDARSGKLNWAVETGPGGETGGLSWGLAVDRKQIYFTNINGDGVSWHVQPSNQTTNSSAYGAVDLKKGSITWETIATGAGQA